MKKRILIDFDGVIHSYVSGWGGASAITDPPVKGAIEWLKILIYDDRFEPVIWTSRLSGGQAVPKMLVKEALGNWFIQHGLHREEVEKLTMTADKLPAHLIVDDRAWAFQGTFPHPDLMRRFEPWRTPKFRNFFSNQYQIYCAAIVYPDITVDELMEYCDKQDCILQEPEGKELFCVELRPDIGPELWTKSALRASIKELQAGELTE